MGVYEYEVRTSRSVFDDPIDDQEPNKAKVRLYWCVIGLVSELLGCSVENLTIVVLTHELAHAYTQLGADIEGRRWHASRFQKAENSLKEGLAQYYTDRVLRRLERRYPEALKAFLALLPYLPAAYHSHEIWVAERSPESIRRAILEVRRWNERTLAQFNARIKAAEAELGR